MKKKSKLGRILKKYRRANLKIVVAVTGASGVKLGIRFLELLPKEIETFAVFTENAKLSLECEEKNSFDDIVLNQNITLLNDADIAAPISSGSFKTDSMIILPCSMNTLAKISMGLCDTLITRAFSVMLKENRKTVIAPREMPYNRIQLEHMAKLSSMGVTVAPPTLGYYSKQQSLEDMENFIIGKYFDILGIENNLYERWGSEQYSCKRSPNE